MAVAVPDPVQLEFVCEAMVIPNVGWVIVAVANPWHPFLSVAVMVYVPALKPEAVRFVPPLGAQSYVLGAVPPVAAFAVALPAELQFAPVVEAMVIVSMGCVIVTDAVAVHPLLSVTVIV